MDWVWAAEAGGGSGGVDPSSGVWRLVWVALGIMVIVFVTRRQKRLSEQRAAARTSRLLADDGENARRAADQALVSLADMSREINAQIDTKIRFLNRLVKEADERIDRLEALVRSDRPAEAAPSSASSTGLHARVRELRDAGKSPAEIARATGLSLLEVSVALRQLEGTS